LLWASDQHRKETFGRVFGDMKEKLGGRYTLLRGLTRIKQWIGFKFAAMILKKLACWQWRVSASSLLGLLFSLPHIFTPCPV
jgi:hypothetical protein